MRQKRDQRRDLIAAAQKVRAETLAMGQSGSNSQGEEQYKPLEWPVLRKVLGLMRPYRAAYALATLVGLVVNLLELLGPLYIKHLVDHDIRGDTHFLERLLLWALTRVGLPGAADGLHATVARHPAYWAIGFTIALWATTVSVALAFQRFSIGYTTRIGQSVLFDLRRKVFAQLQRLSMSYYDKTKFGRILTRGTSDIDTMTQPIVWGTNLIVSNFAIMVIAAAFLLSQDWRLALSVLWLGPVLYFMNRIYKKRIGAAWRTVREGFTRVSTNLAENINGMRVVTAYNRQESNLENFNVLQVANTQNNLDAATVNGIYQPLLQIIGYIGRVIILIFGCYLVIQTASQSVATAFTVGTLMACVMYWDQFMGPVLTFGDFHNQLMMAMASAERIFSLLEMEPEVLDPADAVVLPPLQGHVVFEHVNFEYVANKPVLHDISFEAQPGQTIALVGHTGCGKSTIMNLITRFYLPQTGTVWVDGHDVRKVVGDSLHRQMGIVSQSNYLFSGTVMENIRYANPGVNDEQVIQSAHDLGSHDIISALKDGYNTEVGERGSSLSLGQRQLICFTRAFVANPRILMLDEATSAVDTYTEMLIQQALERLIADRTTFIVAHRLSTVTSADLVLVLDHGKIIERGTHGTLLAAKGKYAELYQQFTRDV